MSRRRPAVRFAARAGEGTGDMKTTRRVLGSLGTAALALAAALAPCGAEAQDAGYRLIVSASNPITELSREEVARWYLGRSRAWPDGERVIPLDQSTKSEVRAAFSHAVLGLSVEAVQTHWMKILLSGRGDPPFVGTEADIIGHVAKSPRVIGYVSAATPLPPTVKAVALRN